MSVWFATTAPSVSALSHSKDLIGRSHIIVTRIMTHEHVLSNLYVVPRLDFGFLMEFSGFICLFKLWFRLIN
jgi:hypothetical protein